MTRPPSSRAGARRRGGVLVEFAIVSVVFYVLFAAIVDMGRATFMASAAQDAARLLARELAHVPLEPNIKFDDAIKRNAVTGFLIPNYSGVFDSRYLVVDLQNDLGPGETLDDWFADKPIVNRALRPLMIYDSVSFGGSDYELFRYPGTLLRKNNTVGGPGNEEFLVVIPEVSHASGGEEIVRWLPVVQEIRAAEVAQSTSQSPFSADSPEGGVVAVRINVPFQSSASASRRIAANDTNALLESGLGDVIYAQTTVTATNLEDVAPGAEVVVGSNSAESVGAYAGSYGLGSFQMLGGEVRPFRRILAGQAIYRREVFALNGP